MYLLETTLLHEISVWYVLARHLEQRVLAHKNTIALAFVIGVSSVIGLQLAYPVQLARPRTLVGGKNVGLHSKNSITKSVARYNDQTVAVNLQGAVKREKPAALGLQIDGEKTAQKAVDYPLLQRFIPFSVFAAQTVDAFDTKVDTPQAGEFAKSVAKFSKAPKDATVTIAADKVAVVDSEPGYTYEEEATKQAIANTQLDADMQVVVPAETVAPKIKTDDAAVLAAQIQERLNTPLSVHAAGHSIELSKNELAKILQTKQDGNTLALSYNRDEIVTRLKELSPYVYIAQTSNKIVLVDGEVAGGSSGKKGKMLLLDASAEAVEKALATKATSVDAKTEDVTPKTQYVRSYTRTSKGLQALIDYWVSSHSGQYGVSLRMIDGSINASTNGTKQFTSASIYKLYVTYVAYTKANNGQLSLSSTTSTGQSVETCIDRMIVVSDNACAVAVGNLIGWSANDGFLRTNGIVGTTLSAGNQLTTANDATTLLVKLQSGTLVSDTYKNSWLDMMRRQIYRKGIPAGSAGSVANKVGFLYALNHDAAIVYHPKGTYVLTVLSNNSSFSAIADLSRQISNVLNQ